MIHILVFADGQYYGHLQTTTSSLGKNDKACMILAIFSIFQIRNMLD